MSGECSSGGVQSRPKGRTEILDLLLPMFSGTKGDYGKEVVPPLPLTFDRVNEGRPPSSNAPSLNFQWRYLQISFCISLRTVSPRDFRQLARSRQFASKDRQANHGRTSLPSLGACIRRLTVATSPAWVEARHGIGLEEMAKLPEEEKVSRMDKVSSAFFDSYIPAIQHALPSLPHLELLDWEDKIDLGPGFFQSLMKSHFHHLKVFRVRAAEEFQVSIPKELTTRGWPLRSLYLELNLTFRKFGDDRPSVLPLSISLLRACARTLKSLTWIGNETDDKEPACADWDLTLPPFENLRDLTLRGPESVVRWNPSILHALITPSDECHLRSLSISPDGPIISELLDKRGKIPSLERLEWEDFGGESSIDFVLANDQSARFQAAASAVSVICQFDFASPDMEGAKYSKEALRLISTLKGLEQICLSAGQQFGWQHNWQIDHEAMRETFSELPKLRKFALPRDSYEVEGLSVEEYYSNPYTIEAVTAADSAEVAVEDEDDAEQARLDNFRHRVREAWERIHLEKMLSEADKYLQALPNHPLEWMYFGQIPMGVRFNEGQKKEAYPLFYERDDCVTLLDKMFNWDTYYIF